MTILYVYINKSISQQEVIQSPDPMHMHTCMCRWSGDDVLVGCMHSREQQGAVGSSREQQEAAGSSREQQGVAGSSREQWGVAGSWLECTR